MIILQKRTSRFEPLNCNKSRVPTPHAPRSPSVPFVLFVLFVLLHFEFFIDWRAMRSAPMMGRSAARCPNRLFIKDIITRKETSKKPFSGLDFPGRRCQNSRCGNNRVMFGCFYIIKPESRVMKKLIKSLALVGVLAVVASTRTSAGNAALPTVVRIRPAPVRR